MKNRVIWGVSPVFPWLMQETVLQNIVWHKDQDTLQTRQRLILQSPLTFWMTGLSGAGKSTLAFTLEKRLIEQGLGCYVLDGDNVRHGLSRNLGFSAEDRSENIRRVSEVARMMNEAGLIVITSLISPYRADREMARMIICLERFREIYISTSLQVCEQRDTKGLYRRARNGELASFTGISDPYEPPEQPSLQLDTADLDVNNCLDRLQLLIGGVTSQGIFGLI